VKAKTTIHPKKHRRQGGPNPAARVDGFRLQSSAATPLGWMGQKDEGRKPFRPITAGKYDTAGQGKAKSEAGAEKLNAVKRNTSPRPQGKRNEGETSYLTFPSQRLHQTSHGKECSCWKKGEKERIFLARIAKAGGQICRDNEKNG